MRDAWHETVGKSLKDAEIPGEHDARERAWRVASAAFAEREPSPLRRARRFVPALALVGVGAVVAGALSAPGRAVFHALRETVGVEKTQPALFSLPSGGRLLVASGGGVWVVESDGSKRRLGAYGEASWSPHGLYLATTRRNVLFALTPKGEERWSLARRDVRFPRWTGSRTDARVAYLTAGRLHVVVGDGTKDVGASGMPAAAAVAPAWQPGPRRVLAYVDSRGRVTAYSPDSGTVVFRTAPLDDPTLLAWSGGDRLLVVTRSGLRLFGPQGQRLRRVRLSGVVAAGFSPDGRRLAVVRRGEVLVLDAGRPAIRRRVFAGGGGLAGLAWSPDGRWLLVGLPDADQWVFVQVTGGQLIRAYANISAQFRTQAFPRIEGWCCADAK